MNQLPYISKAVNLTTAAPDYAVPCQVYAVDVTSGGATITDGPGGPVMFSGGGSGVGGEFRPFNPVPLLFNVGPHLSGGSFATIYVGP